jgi:AcrR family transcriptional regulator
MPEDERRRALIAASAELFLNKGYRATTMDDVARCAGMSKKTLYQTFSNKAELFDALLGNWFSPCFISIEADGRCPREVLTDILWRLITFVVSEQQVAVLRLLISETVHSEDIALALDRQGLGRGKGSLEQWLAIQVSLGVLKIDDIQEAANMLFFTAAGDFIMGMLLRTKTRPTPAQIDQRVERTVQALFRQHGVADGAVPEIERDAKPLCA